MAKYEDVDVGSIPASKYEDVDTKSFTSEKEVDKDPYRVKEAWTALKTAGKGVPILGNYISEDEAMRKFAEDNPWTTTGLKAAGGIGSMLIPGMAIGRIPGIATQMMAGAGLGGMLGAGNNYTSSDPNKPTMGEEAGLSALFGGLGPLGAKILSPKTPPQMPKGVGTVPGFDALIEEAKLAARGKAQDSKEYIRMKALEGLESLRRQAAPILEKDSADLTKQLSSLARSAGDKARNQSIEKGMPHWLSNDSNIRRLSAAALGSSGMLAMGPYGLAAGLLPYAPSIARGGYKAAMKIPTATWANRGIKGSNITTNDIIRAMALRQESEPRE